MHPDSSGALMLAVGGHLKAAIEGRAAEERRSPEALILKVLDDWAFGCARHSAHIEFELERKPKRVVLTARQRAEVFDRFGGICQGCGGRIPRASIWHVDHITRVRDGGSNDPQNLRLMCEACNLQRDAGRSGPE